MKTARLIGRLMFGGFFIYSGINHFVHKRDLMKYAKSKKVPRPDIAIAVSGAALIAGGASLSAGLKPAYGAAAILGFLASATPVMHQFWSDSNPSERQDDIFNFAKNLALAGGALALAAPDRRLRW